MVVDTRSATEPPGNDPDGSLRRATEHDAVDAARCEAPVPKGDWNRPVDGSKGAEPGPRGGLEPSSGRFQRGRAHQAGVKNAD